MPENATIEESTPEEDDKFGFVSKGMPTPQNKSMTVECTAPAGIVNFGNTCYAAAALQVFNHLRAILGRDELKVDMANFENEQNDACETLGCLLNMFPIVECEVVVRSSTTCNKCHEVSEQNAVETILPLPIGNSLQEAM